MKASAISATPDTLRATCRMNQALRLPAASAPPPGVSPLNSARPTSAVASGPAISATADPRSSRSLASCNNTRHSANIESAGPNPTGVSCEIATTCTAAPAHGNATFKGRGDGGSRRKGANANAVPNPYSAKTMRCRVTITAGTKRTRDGGGPARLSGGHLFDQAYGKTSIEPGMHDLEQ